LNEEPDVDHPYASRDRYDELLPVPNGDVAENNQKRCASEGHVPKEKLEDILDLAISLGCNVHIDQNEYDGHESGQTRNGINPYRPAVGLIPSDGIPLKVKIDDELPDVETTQGVPELQDRKEILRDYSGIVEIDHPASGGQSMRWNAR